MAEQEGEPRGGVPSIAKKRTAPDAQSDGGDGGGGDAKRKQTSLKQVSLSADGGHIPQSTVD